MLTLRYFGSFEVRRDGAEITFPTRPCARLLALLATEPGRRWRRESVAAEIWPDAEFGTETVSLRTALTMLRRALGPEAVGSDRERVWVEPGAIASDYERFGALLRREGVETDPDRREASLSDLAECSSEFLAEWEAPWTLPLRQEHARAVARMALELSRVRLASGQYEEARRLALRSLVARPGNDHAIAVAVRAAVALGDRDEALELAARGGTSPELRQLAREIERTPEIAPPVRSDSSELLFDAFESNLREDPEGAVRFLVGNRRFWWRQREIARAKTLLRLGLSAELSSALRALTLHTLALLDLRTSDYAICLAAIDEALGLGPETGLRNDLRMTRGIALQETRRWDEAREELDGHLTTMTREPRDYRTNFVTINRGNHSLQLLEHDEARRYYREAAQDLVADEFRLPYARAFIRMNEALLSHYAGDWPEMQRLSDAASEFLTVRIDPFGAALPSATRLLARAAQGDRGVGPQLGRAPLDPVRLGMRRVAIVVFEYVAEGFAHLGRGLAAVEILRATDALRGELGHSRSPLETSLAERTLGIAARAPGPEVPPVPSDEYVALASWTVSRGDEISA